MAGEQAAGGDPAAGGAGAVAGGRLAAGEGVEGGGAGGSVGGASAVAGDLDDDLVRSGADGQVLDAGLLDEVGGGADDPDLGGQDGGHAVPPSRAAPPAR